MGSPAGKGVWKFCFGNGDSKNQNTRRRSESSSSQTSSSSPPSSQEISTPPPVERPGRHVPDAIHPRFRSREDLLYKCRHCGKTSASEQKIWKHFLKKCPVLSELKNLPLTCKKCEGPSFSYEFKQVIELYHNCNDWAKFMRSPKASLHFSSSSNVSVTPSSISTASSLVGLSTNESSEFFSFTSNVPGTPNSTSSSLVGLSSNQSSSSLVSQNVPNSLPTESQTEMLNNDESAQPMEVIESTSIQNGAPTNGQGYDIH